MSAERYTGSGRRGRTGQRKKDSGAGTAAQAGTLVTLTNVATAAPEQPPAEEHHLGDHLAGFVDGELGHDSRDRVQAHLATCPECLAEADDERAVKQLLAEAPTPGPSALLMARLMAVGATPPDDGEDAFGGPSLGGSRLDGGSFGRGAGSSFGTGGLGAASPLPGVDPRATPRLGVDLRAMVRLRNPVAPPDSRPAGTAATRSVRPSAARGRRFAFAAAGAFSVAAVAISGFGGLTAPDGTTEEPHSTSGRVAEIGVGGVSAVDAPLSDQLPGYAASQSPVTSPVLLPGVASTSTLTASPSPLPYPGALYLSSTIR